MRLLVATTNPGKLREIQDILEGLPVALCSLAACPGAAECAETGDTFEENARQKALHYAAASGLTTVAEDSGLEIDALGGLPGVRSARFDGATYPEKFARIYQLLAGRGVKTSPARFVCALALAEPGRIRFEARGVIEGTLAPAPRGSAGFGYDPIFYYPPLGCTTGEMSAADKAAVSHRGRAFRQLRRFLEGPSAP